jgi:hypothetical protein
MLLMVEGTVVQMTASFVTNPVSVDRYTDGRGWCTRDVKGDSFLLPGLSLTSPNMKNLRKAMRMRITEIWPS